MRKKIKQLMNKEEGFTLVELLAVIVILGLIIAIAVPAIGTIMDDAKTNTEAATITLIEDAARLYDVEETFAGTVTGVTNEHVTVQTLVEEGYLDLRDTELTEYASKYVEKTPVLDDADAPTGSFTYDYK